MATTKREPMSVDLLRQRRNLLVTSLILIAVNLAGAKLKREISALGAGIEFENPERLLWGVWVLWAYFLARYWQYLSEEPDKGIQNGMADWIKKKYKSRLTTTESVPVVEWKSNLSWILKDGTWTDGIWVIKEIPIHGLNKVAWTIRAFLSNAIRTPRFTDYLLPFLVALLPLLIAAWEFIAAIDFITIWDLIEHWFSPATSE